MGLRRDIDGIHLRGFYSLWVSKGCPVYPDLGRWSDGLQVSFATVLPAEQNESSPDGLTKIPQDVST